MKGEKEIQVTKERLMKKDAQNSKQTAFPSHAFQLRAKINSNVLTSLTYDLS